MTLVTAALEVVTTRERINTAIDQHYGEILALARRTVGPGDAEDVTQDAFIKVAQGMWRLDDDANVRAWIYKIALNCCRDFFRRRRLQSALHDGLASGNVGPEQEAQQQELLQLVDGFMATLPRKQREAFVLRRLQGLEYEEIAAVMDSSEDAARANVYQAFKKLKARFAGRVEEYV
jgi:RNA polymerase sigma-70 factor (ECF subfamily)